MLCLAAVAAIRVPESPPQQRARGRDLIAWPLVIATAATIALIVIDRLSSTSRTFVIVLILFGGVVVRLILVIRDHNRLAGDLASALREPERLADLDSLTGVHNRRFFRRTLTLEVRRAVRREPVLIDQRPRGYGHRFDRHRER
ncbi:hypothetical protein Asi02nite_75660 [Asanoa siamensis]|uniref:Uncharacterized protein n=2 Tax=Asanoa siamensis TaxID=926357 RepID=A0ABQ4D3E6_9ACTN|nr:hypothetical protein Asi02nite_75660 [Asanoa siamensis]